MVKKKEDSKVAKKELFQARGVLYIGMITAMLVFAVVPAFATTYYVDWNTGDDANNGLTTGTAWQNIDRGDELGLLAPGDTVEVAAGTYLPGATGYQFRRNGAAGNPITYHANGLVIVDGEYLCNRVFTCVVQSYGNLVFDGFEIVRGKVNGMHFAVNEFVEIKNCIIHDIGLVGTNPRGMFVDYCRDFSIHNNVIYDIFPDPGSAAAAIGIINSWGGSGTDIYNNTMHYAGWFTVHVYIEQVAFTNNIISNSYSLALWEQNTTIDHTYNLYWQNTYGYGTGIVLGLGETDEDPLYVAPVMGNYRLQLTSPAIDTGTDVGLPYVGVAPDRGAYEYDPSAPPATVEGTVSDSVSGLPISGASVEALGTGISDTTGPGGTYTLNLAFGGRYVIRASAAGYLTVEVPVLTASGETTIQNFQLPGILAIDKIGELKNVSPLPTYVGITAEKCATAGSAQTLLDNCFYIEELDRAAGIKVVPGPETPEVFEGDRIIVEGILDNDVNDELYIQAEYISRNSFGDRIRPVGINGRAISEAAGGVLGLSVKIWGRITHEALDGSYIYVDDGAGLDDGSGVAAGVRVILNGIAHPDVDSHVAIIGFAGLGKDGATTIPVIRVPNHQSVAVSDPIVLDSSIIAAWGGHTFSYLLEGEQGVFWCSRPWENGDALKKVIIGQYPKPGSSMPIASTIIEFNEPNVVNANIPAIIRTPDGYIHLFIGVNTTDSYGRIHYFRSAAPEDITSVVDRTSLIPTTPYSQYHLRQNAGISPDGNRMALVSLAMPYGTPVIFIGQRTGLDFTFSNPVQYAESMSLYYPQVAVTDLGIVVVGQNWNAYDPPHVHTTLIHLDWDLNIVNREIIAMIPEGYRWCSDMRPANSTDWNRLILYLDYLPTVGDRGREFWEYDLSARQLTQLRNDTLGGGLVASGKLAPWTTGFINPVSSQMNMWDGDLLGSGPVNYRPIPKTNVLELGYQGQYYTFLPNPLYGSFASQDGVFYVATDCLNPEMQPGDNGPMSFVMWRMQGSTNVVEYEE